MNHPAPLRRGDLHNALIAYARAETDAGRIDAMSLRAAARELGVSSGAVYRHFIDKDALLKAVTEQGFEELRAIFFAIRAEGDTAPDAQTAVARAFAMSRGFVAFAYANATLWRMMFGRVGVMCRKDHEGDPEKMRYTILDCTRENCEDIHRLGGTDIAPTLNDVRFIWSAIHGAADLTQSGVQLGESCQITIADEITRRSLRALGVRGELINAGLRDL